jgi:hypothetical protein
MTSGRPRRSRSASPVMPSSASLSRHLDTAPAPHPGVPRSPVFSSPSAASNTIFARTYQRAVWRNSGQPPQFNTANVRQGHNEQGRAAQQEAPPGLRFKPYEGPSLLLAENEPPDRPVAQIALLSAWRELNRMWQLNAPDLRVLARTSRMVSDASLLLYLGRAACTVRAGSWPQEPGLGLGAESGAESG